MDGTGSLTNAELRVLSLMAQAHSNGEIADRLGVSVRTVESQVGSIMLKLDLLPDSVRDRRVSAVLMYLETGGETGRPAAEPVPCP